MLIAAVVIILALFAVAVAGIYMRSAWRGIKTGVATIRSTSIARSEHPATFWFFLLTMICAAIALMTVPSFIALLVLRDPALAGY